MKVVNPSTGSSLKILKDIQRVQRVLHTGHACRSRSIYRPDHLKPTTHDTGALSSPSNSPALAFCCVRHQSYIPQTLVKCKKHGGYISTNLMVQLQTDFWQQFCKVDVEGKSETDLQIQKWWQRARQRRKERTRELGIFL